METAVIDRIFTDTTDFTRVDMEEYFDEAEVQNLYHWIDRIPLSRPKTDIAKDFSDAGKKEI